MGAVDRRDPIPEVFTCPDCGTRWARLEAPDTAAQNRQSANDRPISDVYQTRAQTEAVFRHSSLVSREALVQVRTTPCQNLMRRPIDMCLICT